MAEEQAQEEFKHRVDKKKPQQQPVKCETCNLTLNSQQQAEQHFGGKAHLKMLRRKGLPVPEEHIGKLAPKPEMEIITNPIVDVQKPPPVQEDGTKLNPVTQALLDNMAGKLPTKRRAEIYCTVCSLELNSQQHADQHFQGSKHAKKVKLMTEAPSIIKASSEDKSKLVSVEESMTRLEDGNYRCNLCGTFSNSYQQALVHVNGSIHSKNLRKKAAEVTLLKSTPMVQPPAVDQPPNPPKSADHQSSPTPLKLEEVQGHKAGWFFCKPCNISVSTAKKLQLHTTTSSHKEKIATLLQKDSTTTKASQ